MVRRAALLAAVTAALLWLVMPTPKAYQAWDPPAGIPDPGFCVNETLPSEPASWTAGTPSATAGYYYVQPSHASDTDTANTYGHPNLPRTTVPTTLPAGSYVRIVGALSISGTVQWLSQGTSGAKVYINATDATISGTSGDGNRMINMAGPYWLLKGGTWDDMRIRMAGTSSATKAEFGCVRDIEITGWSDTGNTSIVSVSGTVGFPTENIVLYNLNIHDNGDMGSMGSDVDMHGVAGGEYANNIWVVDSDFVRNRGDGLQLNSSNGSCCAGDSANARIGHHVYVGRNYFNANYQNGFWSKDMRDVVFSENESTGHAQSADGVNHTPPGQGAPGGCGGHQYGPERVWYLFNRCYGNSAGLHVQSDSNLNGDDVYFIGNLIYDNVNPAPSASPGSSDTSCITMRDHTNRYLLNNTCWGNTGGFHATTGTTFTAVNNIIGGIHANYSAILTDAISGAVTVTHSVFDEDRLRIDGAGLQTIATYGSCTGCSNGTPTFESVAGDDYRLALGDTIAKDTGTTHAAYATYETLHGVNIEHDFAEVARPQNAVWDMGAYEFTSGGGAPAAGTKGKGGRLRIGGNDAMLMTVGFGMMGWRLRRRKGNCEELR